MNALVLHLSGRFLFSLSDINCVRMWDDVDNGHCLRTLQGHQGAVNALGVTPDGTLLISGASENLRQPLRLLEVGIGTLRGARPAVRFVCGRAACLRASKPSSSQTASRQFKQHLNDALIAFESAQYAASYAALARKIAGYERDPRALELNERLTQKLPLKHVAAAYIHSEIGRRHAAGIRSIVFAANGTRAQALGRNDKFIGAWDLATGAVVRTLDGHKQSVEGIAVTSDGHLLLSASSVYTAAIWDVAGGTLKSSLTDTTMKRPAFRFRALTVWQRHPAWTAH